MKHPLILPLTLFALLTSGSVWAHRVNVFAWVEGDAVIAQAKFAAGAVARNSAITVRETQTQAVLLTGKTGADGLFQFKIPPQSKGLTIEVDAGEGHFNRWTVEPDELRSVAGGSPADEPVVPAAAPLLAPGHQPVAEALTTHDIERIVNHSLDSRLAPLQRMLAQSTDRTPTLADIVGGMGWLIGLAGIAAYFRRRPGK